LAGSSGLINKTRGAWPPVFIFERSF